MNFKKGQIKATIKINIIFLPAKLYTAFCTVDSNEVIDEVELNLSWKATNMIPADFRIPTTNIISSNVPANKVSVISANKYYLLVKETHINELFH